jgi:hypothetical protein
MKTLGAYCLALIALAGAASAQQAAVSGALAPEVFAARMQAEREIALKAGLQDMKRLEAAVSAEARADNWAVAEETRLKQAFAGRGALQPNAAAAQVGAAELAGLDCRSARCAIEVTLPQDLPPDRHVAELQAIEDWIATSQPCAYTLFPSGPGSDEPVRAFTECEG